MRFVPREEGFRSYLTFMNRLYSAGLLDPNSFTQDLDQIAAKGEEDRLGAFTAAGPFLAVGTERNEDFVQLTPLTSPESPDPVWPKTANVVRGTFAISQSNPDPAATIRWVDYFYSEAGALLLTNGVEGTDYERTPAGGLQRTYPEDVNPEEHRAGTITPDSGSALPLNRVPVVAITDIGVEETNPQNYYIGQQTKMKLEPIAEPVLPLLYFTPEEQQEVDFLLLDIETFVQEAEAGFVTGQRPLSDWDAYAATLEQIGAARLVELQQAAYDRYVEAGKAAE